MRRSGLVKKEEKKKDINPLWRGIGCLLIVAIFIASFWVSNWFIGRVTAREDPLVLTGRLSVLRGAFISMRLEFGDMVPYFGRIGKYIPELLLAGVVSALALGTITAVYSFGRGPIGDPRDARKFEVEGRKKRNVRKCR